MNVFLMLSHDVVFKPTLLHNILIRSDFKIVGVAEVLSNSKKSSFFKTIKFWGIKGFFYLLSIIIFKKLCSACWLTPSILRNQSTIKRVCKYFSIPYQLVADVNNKEFIHDIKVIKPDVILSFQHQIFGKELLNLDNSICINCHPAALPCYRGVKPIFWAMLNNEKKLGITVHTMNSDIDTGKIVYQLYYTNLPNTSLLQNYYKSYSLSVDAIIASIRKITNSSQLDSLPVIDSSSPYYKAPSSSDLKKFKVAKLRIL
tara:strand:+ start:11248 stop:12021 length:774 start_codon:yes stop_codon:yes gene_type:complete